jgi:outer membrane receptor protein involved in Fe transport
MLAYASVSRGYKGGGFNPPFNPLEFPDQSTRFEPEFVDAFEVGMKNTLLDNTLQANLSAFFYDYSDLQVSKIVNRTSFNENTDAEIYGAEAEFVWAPSSNWTLNANFSYLHTEVKDFASIDARDPAAGRDPFFGDLAADDPSSVVTVKDVPFASACVAEIPQAQYDAIFAFDNNRHIPCSVVEATGDALGFNVGSGFENDLDGNQLTNSPEWSVSLGGQYNWQLAGGSELSMRIDYYWQDEMYTRLYNKPVDKVDDWDIWNAQATYYSSDSSWYARAYVKNLNDDNNIVGHYFTDASSGNFTNVFSIEPRTYGLALGYNF